MIAYVIVNSVNQKRYIGISASNTLNGRWRQHVRRAIAGSKYLLHNAIRKYGAENFSVEHIASARSLQDLHQLERILIDQYRTFHANGHGYNMTLGGEGTIGAIRSDETRAKLRAANLGRKLTPEHIEKLKGRGRKRSPEVVAKMTEMRRLWFAANTVSAETREKLRAAQLGKKLSDETRAKIATAMVIEMQRRRDIPIKEETRKKLRLAKLGKKRSPESVAKTNAANRGRKFPPEFGEMVRARKLGTKHSAEAKAKMRAAKLGKKRGPKRSKIDAENQMTLPLKIAA